MDPETEQQQKKTAGVSLSSEGKAVLDSDGEFSTLAFPFPPPPNSSSASDLPDTTRWQRPNNNETFFLLSPSSCGNIKMPALRPQEAEPQASSLFPV